MSTPVTDTPTHDQSAAAIGKRYAVTARHITQLANDGVIPGLRLGTTWRFNRDEVHEALKSVKAVSRKRSNTVEP